MSVHTGSPLQVRALRDLDVRRSSAADVPYLSAASGLVLSGHELYVVADDEQHLGCFSATDRAPGRLLRMFSGDLPEKPKPRKRSKADMEILLRLPASPERAHGALLALGSGSRPQRRRGALLDLDDSSRVRGNVTVVDAAGLYEQIQSEVGELNLEGGWVHDGVLHLLQRGNRGDAPNAIIEFDFAAVAAALNGGGVLPGLRPTAITRMHLGELHGVPLSFTDACGLPDGNWLFSAVAEDTDEAYADGACVGAVIGLATPEAEIVWQRTLEPARKVEGIHADMQGGHLRVLCVTDPDDREQPAQLLEAMFGAGLFGQLP
jgi:hypothetical protein